MCGVDLWLKAESLQKTGSFKVRGAINALSLLSEAEKQHGVIGVSAGNHGIALAWAGRIAGTRATVVMPEAAMRSKIAAIEGQGGRTVLVDGTRLMESMEEIRASEGQLFIHPFDRPEVIAGQGTIGLEIMEDLPDVEAVVVPVGGGGLISGIAAAVYAGTSKIEVIGVEPEGSTAVSQSLAAGRPLRLKSFATLADGLNAPWSGPNTLSIIQCLVARVVTVSDRAMTQALALMLERTKLLVEPAGAAAVAALLSGRLPHLAGRRVVAVLSGGNVDRTRLADFLKAEPDR